MGHLFADGIYSAHLISKWPDDAIKVSAEMKHAGSEWRHVFFTYDGSGKAAGLKLYLDGEPVKTKAEADRLTGTTRTTAATELGRRSAGEEMRQARYQDIRIYARTLAPDEVARLPREDVAAEYARRDPATWSPDERHTMKRHFFAGIDAQAAAWRKEIAELDAEIAKAAGSGTPTLIAVERERQPAAYLLARGVFNARTERVYPGTPGFLPAAGGVANDRLALARWTLSPSNPLTARVAVNRAWQEIFGTGLVDTPDDFGIMGARPTHPQLLDWLAVDFRENGWNLKRLYRQLVLTAAYRQSAVLRPDHLQKDPANRLLARGPRHRVDAEVLRDLALQTAGLLRRDLGGPPVKGYQPAGIWEAVSMPESNTYRYQQDKGDALYRRSLYSFWKRFAPPPALETFDAPAREVACPRRPRTNTPLQALALMNEPQFVESCRKLAERLLREGTAPETRADRLAGLLLSRPLEPREREILLASAARFAAHFQSQPAAASNLLMVGAAPVDASLPATDLAAWALVASQVLNLDETVTK